MIDVLFVIASRIEQQPDKSNVHLELLRRAVESIEQHFGLHRDQQVMIVDSDSPYREHIPAYRSREFVMFEDAHNKNYEAGAWLHAYRTQVAETYVFMHDSCYVTENFSNLLSRDVTVWKPYRSWKCIYERQKRWVFDALQSTKWHNVLNKFTTVQGAIYSARRSVLERLYNEGLQDILPQNKDQSMGYERLIGNVLTQEGFGALMVDEPLKLQKTFAGRR